MKNKEKQAVEELESLLKSEIKKLPDNTAIAFSGGVDSAVIAKLMLGLGKKFTCYVAGIKGCKDFLYSQKIAKQSNLKLRKIWLNEKKIKKEIPVQIKILKKVYEKAKYKNKDSLPHFYPNPVSVSYNLPLYFVPKYAKEKNIIVCHGPDDLYAGSRDYLKMSKKQALRKMEYELDLLFKIELPQNKQTIEYFNKKVFIPYLDKKIIEFSLKLPYQLRIQNNTRKYILRKLAEKILSREIAYRKRKSAQYGSGIMKVMKKIARQNKGHISEYISNFK